ncbi:hypothetical protein AV530_003750 [Patagioenas fasciata monilis]|uniref:Uncharacterized protein n=1 Tax=Patagioenas fasciata monilis TaxID=372326 RepID=A0A1V4KYD9_PATFA|nr:hypothetical protein AV530_003750 [Patagioenas fasciata monilis]
MRLHHGSRALCEAGGTGVACGKERCHWALVVPVQSTATRQLLSAVSDTVPGTRTKEVNAQAVHGAHRSQFSVRTRTAVRRYVVRSCLHLPCITRSPAGTERLPGTEPCCGGAQEGSCCQWDRP